MEEGIFMGKKERYHSDLIMGKGLWNITKFGKKGRYRIRKIERERGRGEREGERSDGGKL